MTRRRMVVTLGVILALAAGGFGLLYWRLDQQRAALGLEAGKALLNLMLIGIAAMIAKTVVDQYAAAGVLQPLARVPGSSRLLDDESHVLRNAGPTWLLSFEIAWR